MRVSTSKTNGPADEPAIDMPNGGGYSSDGTWLDEPQFSELEDPTRPQYHRRSSGWDAVRRDPKRAALIGLSIIILIVVALAIRVGLPVPDRPTISATEDTSTEQNFDEEPESATNAPLLQVEVADGGESPTALSSDEPPAQDGVADETPQPSGDGATAEASTEEAETVAPSNADTERPISVPGMSALGNVKLRTNKGAYRFQAERTGNIENLRLYFVANTRRPGYADGTGGTVRVTVAPDDGNGQPDAARAFDGTFDVKFSLKDGADTSGDLRKFITEVLLGKYTFSQPIPVEAGKNYFIIFHNIDSDPNANNVSLDLVFDLIPKDERPGQPVPSPARRTDIGFHQQASGSGWRSADIHRDGHWMTPIFEVTYADGFSQGQGFMQWQDEGSFTLAGSSAIRTLITLPADRTVSELSARVKSHSSGSVTLELTDGNGSVLRSTTVRANARVNLRGAVWATGNVEPITLKAGQQYALVMRAANGYSGNIVPLQAGSAYGYSKTSLFPFGEAQTSSNGSSWNSWGRLYPSIAIK